MSEWNMGEMTDRKDHAIIAHNLSLRSKPNAASYAYETMPPPPSQSLNIPGSTIAIN
jgi:hypothetical protein